MLIEESRSRSYLQGASWAQRSVAVSVQVHLKFEINPYDPAILRQLILSGSEQPSLGSEARRPSLGSEARRPLLAWLEEESSCSDIPKLEGDRYYAHTHTHTNARARPHKTADSSFLPPGEIS